MNQLTLAGAINEAHRAAKRVVDEFDEALRAKRSNLSGLIARVIDLEKFGFGGVSGTASPAELRVREMLTARTRNDRPRLYDLEITGGTDGVIDRARPLIAEWAGVIERPLVTPDEWRSAAARVLDLADDLRRLT